MSKIWERPDPEQRSRRMTPAQKAAATKAAHRAGRSTPSLVDNINAMRPKD